MIFPKNPGHGNTFEVWNIKGTVQNLNPNAKQIFFINGKEVTREEYINFDADNK